MLRAGLVTVLLMGLGSTAMASDRVRVFVNYNSGGYYHVGRHYNDRDCHDGRHWARRDRWNRPWLLPQPAALLRVLRLLQPCAAITGGATLPAIRGA